MGWVLAAAPVGEADPDAVAVLALGPAMSDSWESELAMIRQRAAVNCGLERYPAELVRVFERLTAYRPHPLGPGTAERLEGRLAELLAGVRELSPEG